MERSALWGSCPLKSLLAFTSVLLLCEITVGRLCKSLINMVDSFHTIYVLVHIILYPSTNPVGASGTSFVNPCPFVDARQPALTDPNANPKTSVSSSCSKEYQYTKLRAQPFVALISSLLLTSLCVSIAFEILGHLGRPHYIERPLLATVLGVVSLIFNSLMLVWRRCGRPDLGAQKKDLADTLSATNDKEGSTLMFCNSVASGVLDPEQIPSCQTCTNAGQPKPNEFTEQTQQTSNITGSAAELATCTTSISHTVHQQPHMAWHGSHRSIVVTIRSLLGSVLVLVNGLALLFKPDCSNRHWPCHLLLYLDPGFSLITVVAFLATTMPELWHHGLLLLQAVPEHLSVEEVMAHIGRVPGVLAVHELHVWQLSDACLVASVHVHCSLELDEQQCSHLLVSVTQVLRGFGVNHCTVQPEFLTAPKAGPGVQEERKRQSNAPGKPQCSLPCERVCAKNMCCISPEEQSKTETCPTVHLEVGQQNIVIKNVYRGDLEQ